MPDNVKAKVSTASRMNGADGPLVMRAPHQLLTQLCWPAAPALGNMLFSREPRLMQSDHACPANGGGAEQGHLGAVQCDQAHLDTAKLTGSVISLRYRHTLNLEAHATVSRCQTQGA